MQILAHLKPLLRHPNDLLEALRPRQPAVLLMESLQASHMAWYGDREAPMSRHAVGAGLEIVHRDGFLR